MLSFSVFWSGICWSRRYAPCGGDSSLPIIVICVSFGRFLSTNRYNQHHQSLICQTKEKSKQVNWNETKVEGVWQIVFSTFIIYSMLPLRCHLVIIVIVIDIIIVIVINDLMWSYYYIIIRWTFFFILILNITVGIMIIKNFIKIIIILFVKISIVLHIKES